MGYFASGWPKTYVLPQHQPQQPHSPSAAAHPSPHHVHSIHLDPFDRHVLTVSSRGLHIWSAGHHRVLQARFVLSPKILDEEGPFVDAVWSPDSSIIVASLAKGLTLLFRVAPHEPTSLLSFNLPPQHLIQPPPLHPLHLTCFAELRVAHTDTVVSAMASCPAGALIATSSAALTCVAWDADVLWRAHLPELLRHNDAITKMGLVAPGETSCEPPVAAIQTETTPDDAGGILALSYNRELAFCAVVLGSGPALLLAMHSAGRSRPSAIDGRWLRSTDAVSIALEPRRMLATVGLRNGDVEQYYIGVPAGDRCPLMRTLSLSNWYFDPADVGAPTVLRWTHDGSALVVGWERRGLAVWSVSGCRLMCTLSQVGGPIPTTPAQRNRDSRSITSVNPMEQGVLAAAWGPQGLFLWASPRHTPESPPSIQSCHFLEFSFFKGSSRGGFCESDSSRLAMFGSDRVLLLWQADGSEEDAGQETGAASSDIFSWQHLIIPHDYLWRNWPPTNIAISADASCVAVAGEHGVAICHVRNQRWRVFGDLEHDRRIRCCALAWVGKTIVIGNEVITPSTRGRARKRYELLFYPRDQFDSTALRAQWDLPSRPVLTDVRADGYLLVICEDAQVFLFKINEHYNRSRLDLRMVYTLLLPTREGGPMYHQDVNAKNDVKDSSDNLPPPAPGGGISQAKIFPPLTHSGTPNTIDAPIPTHIMLLRSTGSLILLDTERMVSTALLRYVERFWYTPVDCTPFNMISHRPVWWAYGDDGLHVCFQDGLPMQVRGDVDPDEPEMMSFSSRRRSVEVEQWFELDPEVYPLTIMSKYGMLLGATQGLVVNNVDLEVGSTPSHTIQVKRLPTLHTLLRHILMKPACDERVALQIALKCVQQPQFIDSLEWLLYEAVLEHDDDGTIQMNGSLASAKDDVLGLVGKQIHDRTERHAAIAPGFPESPRRKKAGSNLFPRVIRLLKYFGEYEDVVVRCARKLDSKRWPLLFSLAGEPAALLEQCFVSGRLRTAACLLVILQEMWGFISSTPHSLRLVRAALSRGELDLAADLANFLGKADRAGMLNSSQLRTTEDVSWIAEAVRAPKGSALNKVLIRKDSREEPSDRIPAVDLAVLNHARSLLNRMDLRNLVALSVKMDFPLSEWLKRELKGKNASRPFVRDFGTTILALHRQFQYPEPDLMDVRRAMKAFNTEMDGSKNPRNHEESSSTRANGVASGKSSWPDEGDELVMTPRSAVVRAAAELVAPGMDTVFGSQLPPPPSATDNEMMVDARVRARQLCFQELSYMMTVARLARAPDVTLCCATLLLDVSVLRMVLRGHEELFGPFVAALNEFNVSGYDALVAVLNEIAVPR